MSLKARRANRSRLSRFRKDLGLGPSTRPRYSAYPLKEGWRTEKREPFKWTRKKIIGLVLASLLISIFLVGDYGPIRTVHADYNTSFSHTRTPIWSETDVTLPITGITLTDSDQIAMVSFATCTTSPRTFPAVDVFGTGDTILIFFFRIGAGSLSTVTDNKGNTYTGLLDAFSGSGSGASISVWKATTVASGLTTITFTFASGCWGGVVHSYRGVSGFGDTETNGSDNAADSGSSSLALTLTGNNSTIAEAFAIDNDGLPTTSHTYTITPTSGQTTRQSNGETSSGVNFYTWKSYDETNLSGSQTQTTTWSTVGGDGDNSFRHVGIELRTTGTSASPDNSLVRWNFNFTCVELSSSPRAILFRYIEGTTGSGGNNCNSAAIAITKTTLNLQTVSARMLEMVMAIDDVSSTRMVSFQMVLRHNGTLPRFNENYDPFNDKTVALIWEACPNYACASQSVYISHKDELSIRDETKTSTLVITGPSVWAPPIFPMLQVVLNFTGPNNFINAQLAGSNNSTSTGLASSLQMAQDFYILLKANFDTTKAPCGGCRQHFRFGDQNAPVPKAFQIFSVPASCADPVNRAACSLAATQPVVSFDLLDPSSWANAIVKSLVWAFTIGIPLAFGIALQVTIVALETVLNFVGGFFGLGNIGTIITDAIQTVVTFFTSYVPTLFLQQVTIFARWLDTLTFLFSWIPIALSIALNMLTLMINGLTFVLTMINYLFRIWGLLLFLMLSYFWFFDVGDYGLSGYMAWFETAKWLIFGLGIRPFTIAIDFTLDVITAIIGLVPKPFVQMVAHKFPRLPIIEITGNPVWPDFELTELRKMNVFSVGGVMIGALFMVWFQTTSLPGSITAMVPSVGTTLTRLNSITNIGLMFLMLFGFTVLFLLPAKLWTLVSGIAVERTLPVFSRLAMERGRRIPTAKTRIRVVRKPAKRFQKRLERKVEARRKAKETFAEKLLAGTALLT